MKNQFQVGDVKRKTFRVMDADEAAFEGTVVHSVCSTFSLAREIEWATRQYVLEMREEDEEGVGTFLSIEHVSPAFVGEEVLIESKVDAINGNELICSYTAFVKDRVVATGKTGQKILTRKKLATIFSKPVK